MSLTPRTVLDQYEILSTLGAGGMGEVYRARDLRLNRDVAIKVLHDFSSDDPNRLSRFEQEARAAAALNHPNILAVYEMGTYEGVPYLVSELLDGETLRERLKRGPLPLRKVIDSGVQIARGLAAAHEKGIVHRDLKPENLFLTRDGQVKILDFGLARVLHSDKKASNSKIAAADSTEPGVVMGTASYMSPEQVRGEPADHRSDIFAFSAIIYEMLAGKRVFLRPTTIETMSAILNEDSQSLLELVPTAPMALQKVIHRGLEKNPEQRFQSASDLAFALEALSDATLMTHPVQAMAVGKPSRVFSRLIAGALALVLLLAIVDHFWLRPSPVPYVDHYVQLTHDGLQKSLIGTDGSRIYMTLINSGVQDVAAIQPSGGVESQIPMPSPSMVPVDVSPDGSSFLIVDGNGFPAVGPLWSLSVFGGSPRRLANTIGDVAAWSPDGKSLAYSNGGDAYLARADGTDSRKLWTMKVLISDLVWSPDGSRLRFGTSDFSQSGIGGTGIGQQAIWEIAADGSNPHRLLEGWHNPPDECCGRWTANGKYFVFQSQGQIWALPKEGGFLHSKVQPIQLTSSPMSLHSPLPSRDGKKIYVVGRTYRGELESYDVKSHIFQPFLFGISAEFVEFSKDGQWAAYVSYPEGELWKCKSDGSQRTQLTFPPFKPILPRWSPDGKTIVFFSFPVSSTQPGRIYTIPADGGTPNELMPGDPHNQQDPTWSPDGSRIAFGGDANDAAVTSGTPAIHVLNLSTRKISDIPGSQGLYSPRWSPDGRYLAAMSADSQTVLIYDFQSSKWTELAKGTFGWLAWSKDSKFIYLKDFAGKGAVARIEIADHKMEKVADLTNFADTGQAGGSLTLSPDDSPLLLRDTGTQDIYSLDWTEP
ncbi:MAG TPA: protein kinase [Terracidiphilus sp.]|nr:protein kinase [Terracidiphilus sp.]